MPGINLKHYEIYMQILENYAKGLRIKITYSPRNDLGVYSSTTRRIGLDSELSQSWEVATLLHELGHCIDDASQPEDALPNVWDAYRAVYSGDFKAKHKKLVVECEKRAWQCGRGLAKKLGIKLGKWYTDVEQECLQDYLEVKREIQRNRV